MFLRRIRGVAITSLAVAIAACGGGDGPTGSLANDPAALAIVSGNGQVGLVGQTLTTPLVVRVSSGTGPLAGVGVTFEVVTGSATLSQTSVTTNSEGQATTQVTFGSSPGNITITAKVASKPSLLATFTLTAGSGNLSNACQGATPNTPAAGGVLPGVSGTGICLGGGSLGAEYALIAFNSNPDSTTGTSLPVFVTARGASSVTTANVAPSLSTVSGVSPLTTGAPSDLRSAFDARLRRIAQRELAPLVPGAIEAMRRRPAFTAIPANPTIGSTVTLNANGEQACTSIKNVQGRIAGVSNKAIIVADVANPSGGFTDAEYQSFAVMFDTLINPLDVQNFGEPSDIDNNGKIIIFFTKEVNALTPAGSGGIIGGFFFERDLFPLNTSGIFAGCAGSNLAEMFYVLVPDPNGTINGNRRTKQRVLDVTPGTIAHEYQHLINAGRRMYVTPQFNDFENTWLNEGLSHIAEELLYYRVSGLAPRQNLRAQTIASSQALVDAFNHYQADNSGRFETFLDKPSRTSVYGNNDSLETRGAAWHLLRYLADHRGSSDGDTWQQLVNTNTVGLNNIARVFGSDYMTKIRDWATSVFSDDVDGVTDARFLAPSWNMRDIFPRLVDGQGNPLGRYPLDIVPISEATPATLSIFSGGAAYLRFSVPAGGQASVDWSAGGLPASPLIQFTVVRTR